LSGDDIRLPEPLDRGSPPADVAFRSLASDAAVGIVAGLAGAVLVTALAPYLVATIGDYLVSLAIAWGVGVGAAYLVRLRWEILSTPHLTFAAASAVGFALVGAGVAASFQSPPTPADMAGAAYRTLFPTPQPFATKASPTSPVAAPAPATPVVHDLSNAQLADQLKAVAHRLLSMQTDYNAEMDMMADTEPTEADANAVPPMSADQQQSDNEAALTTLSAQYAAAYEQQIRPTERRLRDEAAARMSLSDANRPSACKMADKLDDAGQHLGGLYPMAQRADCLLALAALLK